MSSALNLIIARGFSGTGASDVGNAMRGEQDRQMARDSEQLNQAAAVFNQQQAQRQAEQQTRDQAMLDSSRSAFEPILSRIGALEPRLIAMRQSGQMDPALIAEAQALDSELKRTALSAQAKLAPQSMAEMLIPKSREQATQEPQGPSFGNVNPADYTPASLAKFAQTQNYGDLVRQYAPTGSGGKPERGRYQLIEQYDPETGGRSWQAVNIYDPADIKTLGGKAPPPSVIAAADKAVTAGAKLAEGVTTALRSANNVFTAIDSAIANTNRETAGFTGHMLEKAGWEPSVNLKEMLETIKANIGFDRLQQMRRDSPTGGALGQVAIQELEALQKSIASLSTRQSPDQLKDNLGAVKQNYMATLGALQQAAQMESAILRQRASRGDVQMPQYEARDIIPDNVPSQTGRGEADYLQRKPGDIIPNSQGSGAASYLERARMGQ